MYKAFRSEGNAAKTKEVTAFCQELTSVALDAASSGLSSSAAAAAAGGGSVLKVSAGSRVGGHR